MYITDLEIIIYLVAIHRVEISLLDRDGCTLMWPDPRPLLLRAVSLAVWVLIL